MTLTTRLTAFFLGVLAAVLAGFSLGLYLLARVHLYGEVDDRLNAALHTLVAAAGVEPDGIEWDRRERRLALGADRDQVLWRVCDGDGQFVDGARNADSSSLLAACPPPTTLGRSSKQTIAHDGQTWWILQRRLHADPAAVAAARATRVDTDDDDLPAPKFATLSLTAAVSLEHADRTLARLALVTTGLSAALWLCVALVGRAVCRKALTPLINMSTAARSMSAADLDHRLPIPHTGDEIENLSRAINDLLGRLEDSFERQRRFTGDASHQLRTPLTAVLGQIEVALRRSRTPQEYERVLKSVEAQAGQLRHIVEMLLFLARADSETRLPHLEEMPISAWLAEHLQTWAGHERAGDLQFVAAHESLWVEAQPPLLGQLVDNLLDNAFKYSDPASAVVVRLEAESSWVKLVVEDSGCGIAVQDLPHVFDAFYRSADARCRGHAGVGLGLAVVQRIAEAFGGTIHVASDAGRGTRFTVALRRVAPPKLDPAHATAAATPVSAETGQVQQV